MKRLLGLTLALALVPAAAFAQEAAPPATASGFNPPTQAQRAQMQQFHAQLAAYRQQSRARMIAALTPAHRSAIATLIGQLALSPNADPRTGALQVDALLMPAEKTSIVNVALAEHTAMRSLMEQQRAAMESTMSADEKAAMAARAAKMQAFEQSHPRPAPDAGEVLLRTLADVGGPMHRPHF